MPSSPRAGFRVKKSALLLLWMAFGLVGVAFWAGILKPKSPSRTRSIVQPSPQFLAGIRKHCTTKRALLAFLKSQRMDNRKYDIDYPSGHLSEHSATNGHSATDARYQEFQVRHTGGTFKARGITSFVNISGVYGDRFIIWSVYFDKADKKVMMVKNVFFSLEATPMP